MRQVTKKGLLTIVAAGGVLAMTGGGAAYADSGAQNTTSNSPGVGSGNSVEAPVEVPVNVCGNSIDVIGLLNPSNGNDCESTPDDTAPPQDEPQSPDPGTSTPPSQDTPEDPGSGTSTPPSYGDGGGDGGAPQDRAVQGSSVPMQRSSEPVAATQASTRAADPAAGGGEQLAETGGGEQLAGVGALGAGLMIGGYVLYRRGRGAQAAYATQGAGA